MVAPKLVLTPHASTEDDDELYKGFDGALHVDMDEAADAIYLINHDETRTFSGYPRSAELATVATIHPHDFSINYILYHQKKRFSELLRHGGQLTPPPSGDDDTVTTKEQWQCDMALRQVLRGVCRALDSIVTSLFVVRS